MNISIALPVLIEVVVKKRDITTFSNIVLALLGSLFIALTAQIAIPLPFSPVPITGQTFGVFITGIVLGAKRGALSAIFYILEGAMGMPVFAGLKGGLPYLLGPTGGYILGFVPAAYVAGCLAQRGWDRDVFKSALCILASNGIIYLAGLAILSLYVASSNLLTIGLYPFILGDILKVSLAVLSMNVAWRILGRS